MGNEKAFLNTATGTYSWHRGADIQLTDHFNSKEFECSCGSCSLQKVSVHLLNKLEAVRVAQKQPIRIHSGYRCKAYQNRLSAQGYQTAAGTSQHELGNAADVSAKHMSTLYPILEKHFSSIGLARTFLHVDLRADKTRRWNYT